MLVASLPDFVEFLVGLTPADFRSSKVDEWLRDQQVDREAFFPFIYFREDTYARNLIFKNDHFELLALTWLPQQRTPIHDHSGSRCWMFMQSGQLDVRNYHWNDGSGLLVPESRGINVEGETVLYADDSLGLHSLANTSRQPAVSIHLYAAPISRCRIYNEKSKSLEWTSLDYFTQITSEEYTSETTLQ